MIDNVRRVEPARAPKRCECEARKVRETCVCDTRRIVSNSREKGQQA
jgi:hypothetical protein